MTVPILLFFFGSFLLYSGASILIHASVALSLHFKIPRLVIGLTVVAFCTSMPEVLVSIFAQLDPEASDIALGNVLGSNIANIGLVLAIYLILRPCKVTKEIKHRKMGTLFFVYLLLFLVMYGGKIHLLEGIFFIVVLALYVAFEFLIPPKRQEIQEEIALYEAKKLCRKDLACNIAYTFVSIFLLLLGTKALVEGAIAISSNFGISQRVIAISAVAIGTSMPELATALVAASRNEEEIMVGTVIGSNIFNPLLVIGLCTLIKPLIYTKQMLTIDFPFMVSFSLLLWILMKLGKDRLSRLDGLILLGAYVAYLTFLFV